MTTKFGVKLATPPSFGTLAFQKRLNMYFDVFYLSVGMFGSTMT